MSEDRIVSPLASQDSSHSTSSERVATMTAPAPLLAAPTTLRVLCFGDSLTSGYTSSGLSSHPYSLSLETVLSAAFPDTDIHIETDGLPGDRVGRPGTFTDRIMLYDEPYDWTIVLGGTNDLGYGTSARDVYDALVDVWDWVLDRKRDERGRVLALTVPEAPGQNAWTRRITHEREVLNSMIERRRRERFHVFDLCSALPHESLSQSERELYWDDGLHLTTNGYDRMGELIGDHLVGLIRAQEAASE